MQKANGGSSERFEESILDLHVSGRLFIVLVLSIKMGKISSKYVKESVKLIFVDVDGVLNCLKTKQNKDKDPYLLDLKKSEAIFEYLAPKNLHATVTC